VSEVVLLGNPGTTDDPAPTESGTWPASSQYDISRYTVQAWSGSAWQTVASVSGNTKHIVRLAFAPVTTDRIRVIPADDASNGQTANDNLVSLTEIEVRSPAGAGQMRTQRFDAWGRIEQAAGSVPTYGFTGREPDATGLIHYRARYYHPELGRFVSRDPLGLSAGINPYAYADGNPVLFNDPDGLMAKLAWNSSTDYLSRNGTRILDGTQTVLDVAGLVPVVGEFADGANALIYLGRGDNTNAALSGAAMIPFVGWGATTVKVAGKVDNAVGGAEILGKVDGKTIRSGDFSIVDWAGYPAGVPKPAGPVNLIPSAEYQSARAAANAENRALHRADPSISPQQIHEIQPVRFGGTPTDPANKVYLDRSLHQQVTNWWNDLQRYIQGVGR
jgi:RHS repeat-associated protein